MCSIVVYFVVLCSCVVVLCYVESFVVFQLSCYIVLCELVLCYSRFVLSRIVRGVML